MDAIPSDPLIAPRKAGLMLAALLLIVALLSIGAVALPHNRYIRYQQFASGDFSRVRWVYERLHFDKTPIDVAVIGSSRTEAAISGPKLERALSARFGRPIHVANLAVPLEGRDAHYAIAQELLRTHPETRLVLLSIVEPTRLSHPAFRNIGDSWTVIRSPIWLNYFWLENVAFLPYRNASLFVQSLFPSWFGMDAQFNARHYQAHGTNFDTTESFRLDNGALVDRERYESPEKLEHAAATRGVAGASPLARITGADDNIIEHAFSMRLANEFRARCVDLVLIHMPIYRGDNSAIERSFYDAIGPVLITPPGIGDDWTDFADAAHLRRTGIDKVTRWLPDALAPYAGAALQNGGCGPQ